jgi:hypothetical protein
MLNSKELFYKLLLRSHKVEAVRTESLAMMCECGLSGSRLWFGPGGHSLERLYPKIAQLSAFVDLL